MGRKSTAFLTAAPATIDTVAIPPPVGTVSKLRPGPAALGIACAGLVLWATSLPGQRASASAPTLEEATSELRFRRVGPATMGGRVSDLAVDEADPAHFYVATATGGLWKTTNAGTTWEVLFDDQPDAVSLGAVAVSPADPERVWVGTGEQNNRQSSSWGNGVYLSADGGATWRHVGLTDSRHIARIVVDPADPAAAWVAALGSLWGPGGERGVYRTRDGGTSWDRVLYVNDDTGAIDLLMHPSDPRVLYAATYQRRRADWGFSGGGPGSGIYRSHDGGDSWERLTVGVPPGPLGRIGLAIHRADPDILYATIEHETEGGVYRSDDGGSNWRRVGRTNPRPMYFSKIRVDPADPSRVYLLAQALLVSDDGGASFHPSWAAHPDHHALWIDPSDPDHLIDGNDGGIAISNDGGRNWRAVDNMDLAQVYHVGFDMNRPYGLYAGLQDNMSWVGPSATRSRLGIGNGDWSMVGEYDGFVTLPEAGDPRTIYTEAPGGRIFRVDRVTNERKLIQPRAREGEPPLRWNWDAPLILSPHDGTTLLAGANRVYRSRDRGHSWQGISPDLTTGVDRDTLTLMGLRGRDIRLSRHDGVSAYPTITALAESPARPGLLYAGTDDGRLQVSRDDGGHWEDITPPEEDRHSPARLAAISPSRFDSAIAYVAFDGHRADDYTPHVYVTEDGGRSWIRIVDGIPDGHVVRSIAEDLRNPDLIFLGTEFGLLFSIDRGRRWNRLRANLPTVPVYEIKIHPRANDLILATHGRGIWILDDIAPLQELAASRGRATLFPMRPATQQRAAEDRHFWGDQRFWGDNPPRGAIIGYALPRPAREVRIEVRDASGRLVRTFGAAELPRPTPGIHRVVWDLRHQPHAEPLIRVTPISELFAGNGIDAPFVEPGEYRVTLRVEGRNSGAAVVVVRPDPDSPVPPSQLQQTRVARATLYDLHARVLDATAALDAATAAMRSFRDALDRSSVSGELRALHDSIDAALDGFGQALGTVARSGPGRESIGRRVGALEIQLLRASDPPTAWEARAIEEARIDLRHVVRRINGLISDDLPRLASGLGRSLPPIDPVTEPPPDLLGLPDD